MFNWLKNLFGGQLFGAARSSQWPRVRKEYLMENPLCEVCNGRKKTQVHHVIPYHIDPTKELDKDNFITLCEKNNCHFLLGHLGSFHSWNENIKEDAKYWNNKITYRP